MKSSFLVTSALLVAVFATTQARASDEIIQVSGCSQFEYVNGQQIFHGQVSISVSDWHQLLQKTSAFAVIDKGRIAGYAKCGAQATRMAIFITARNGPPKTLVSVMYDSRTRQYTVNNDALARVVAESNQANQQQARANAIMTEATKNFSSPYSIEVRGIMLGRKFVQPPGARCGVSGMFFTCKLEDNTEVSIERVGNIVSGLSYRFPSTVMPTRDSPTGKALIAKYGMPTHIGGVTWSWQKSLADPVNLYLTCERLYAGFCMLAATDRSVSQRVEAAKQRVMQSPVAPKF